MLNKYEIHMDICKELNNTYKTKNHDYGDSFGKGFKEYGMMMPVIRIEDKFNRFKKLATGSDNQVKDESIRDTLIDLVNYALMTVVEMDILKEYEEVDTPECVGVSKEEAKPSYITVHCPTKTAGSYVNDTIGLRFDTSCSTTEPYSKKTTYPTPEGYYDAFGNWVKEN